MALFVVPVGDSQPMACYWVLLPKTVETSVHVYADE